MTPLKTRKNPSQSRNKIFSMIDLYEKYVDETIQTISILSPTMYLVNSKYVVDIQSNKVHVSYPNPE